MTKVEQIADSADMIVSGYAFTVSGDAVRVINLNRPDKAAVLSEDGAALETSMDDIELAIATAHYTDNKQFLGE